MGGKLGEVSLDWPTESRDGLKYTYTLPQNDISKKPLTIHAVLRRRLGSNHPSEQAEARIVPICSLILHCALIKMLFIDISATQISCSKAYLTTNDR